MQQIIAELEKLGYNPYYRYPQILHVDEFLGWRLSHLVAEYGIKVKVHRKPIEI